MRTAQRLATLTQIRPRPNWWMDKPDPKFPDNTRVKLRDGVHPGFYQGRAYAGMEGWIRKHKSEDLGYQEVYIEWDRDHWSYNNTPDLWTWEDHFEKAKEPLMSTDKPNKLDDLVKEFTKRLVEMEKEEAEEQPDPIDNFLPLRDLIQKGGSEKPSFAETLEEAMDEAANSEAFVVIAVKKREYQKKEIMVPTFFSHHHDKRADLFGRVYLANLVAGFLTELIEEKIGDEDE